MSRGWSGRKIAISMSRPGNPYDNAKAESFMKTLKTEEVNGKTYANLDDARGRSARSSKTSTTPSACTRRSAINRRSSSKPNSAGITTTANQNEAVSPN